LAAGFIKTSRISFTDLNFEVESDEKNSQCLITALSELALFQNARRLPKQMATGKGLHAGRPGE
jgi:hypothetical protein